MTELKMPEDQIYCKSPVNDNMVKITAIFGDARAANVYLATHAEEDVIYQADSLVFIANICDLGKGMSIITAKNLKQGQTIYHVTRKNADGTAMRAKVTSVKTWKTRPLEVIIKWKRGLYEFGTFDHTELLEITDKEPSV